MIDKRRSTNDNTHKKPHIERTLYNLIVDNRIDHLVRGNLAMKLEEERNEKVVVVKRMKRLEEENAILKQMVEELGHKDSGLFVECRNDYIRDDANNDCSNDKNNGHRENNLCKIDNDRELNIKTHEKNNVNNIHNKQYEFSNECQDTSNVSNIGNTLHGQNNHQCIDENDASKQNCMNRINISEISSCVFKQNRIQKERYCDEKYNAESMYYNDKHVLDNKNNLCFDNKKDKKDLNVSFSSNDENKENNMTQDCNTEKSTNHSIEKYSDCKIVIKDENRIKMIEHHNIYKDYIVNIKQELNDFENENIQLKNKIFYLENIKSIDIKTEESKSQTSTQETTSDATIHTVEQLQKTNKELENENCKLVADKIAERKLFIKEIEKFKEKYCVMVNKFESVINELQLKNDEITKELIDNKNYVIMCDERNREVKGVIENIKSFQGKNDEMHNLYQEIIKVTKLYEETQKEKFFYENKYKQFENDKKYIESVIEKNKIYKEEINKYELKINICHSENIVKYEKLLTEFEERKNAAQFHKRNTIKLINEIEILKKKLELLEKEHNETNGNNNENYNKSDLMVDLENYRKLLRCTACDKKYKDTIILRCMHVFCKDCIDERIKSRNRNCPNCNENFHTADVKRIYL
ncbi:E3 ubiquitin-protein ligase bre1 [Conglomerata obtusa]